MTHYDFVIIGSGFGGSVSALRLVEKGYSVLLVEKGRRFRPEDFPKSNFDLVNWLWLPKVGFRGIQKLTFLRHVTVLSGVGVGGGSLVYANTLPVPKTSFFTSGSWAGLREWEEELAPFYATAKRMLGATTNPTETYADTLLKEIAVEMGRGDHIEPTEVAVYFGEPGVEVEDPFFDGEGPSRTGCIECGGCMIGCRFGAKNTLETNYLWLAEKKGLTIVPDTEVTALRPGEDGGYVVEASRHRGAIRRAEAMRWTADRVVLSGGVLGTMDLLLKMKEDPNGLPNLSPRLGDQVRTNSESLIGVMDPRREHDHSKGVAITSIFHTDAHSHVEPVRYSSGSGFYRFLLGPHAPGETLAGRMTSFAKTFVQNPLRIARSYTVPDLAKNSTILLYMRSLEGTLKFTRGPLGLSSQMSEGEAPAAFIPEATAIAERFAEKVGGVAANLFTESVLAIPTTAHILGGACIGADESQGVIDTHHEVFNYPGLFVCDGSAISANPGVNPSLTITAMSERAMSGIAAKR